MTESGHSWFGPGLEADSESEPSVDEITDAARSTTTLPEARPFFQQERRRTERSEDDGAFVRLYRSFLLARAALGLALVVALVGSGFFGARAPRWAVLLVSAYALQALTMWLFPRLQRGATVQALARVSSPQWWASIGLDLAVFGLLHALGQGASINYGALFVLPVLMAGVLAPRVLALATAAMAALLMLVVAGWSILSGAAVGLRMTEAGLVGAGFFAISLLANEMATRLRREQQAARGSLEYARQQAQLSRLVIDEMAEGVLVVDRRGHVRAANPSARVLLADSVQPMRAAPFQLRGVVAWGPLVQAVEQAFAAGAWPEAGRDVHLRLGDNLHRALRLRMRFTRRRGSKTTEDVCVLFIEDIRLVQQRSQQEKLAAMGRVSVGIAHEFRNPLAAISQANALLGEDSSEPRAQQLTRMVASNVERLKRIVDDVMELAPGRGPETEPVDASLLVAETCLDWARTNELPPGPDDPLACSLPVQPLVVSFETEHLRRVLVNLLDNALRHADKGPGGVQVALAAEPLAEEGVAWARLAVFSAGAPIAPDVERHLFEPFFSTRSRGSGLGLYICRELCERHGARLDYRHRASDGASPAGNEFILRLRLFSSPSLPSRTTEP